MKQGTQKGFTVHDIDLIEAKGGIISSSAIRNAVQNGDMEQAREWLNRAYSVTGEVIHGEKRGRQIGYPTANTAVWDEQVLPANGIYAGWAHLGNERFMAMTNVSVRPTFDGRTSRLSLICWILTAIFMVSSLKSRLRSAYGPKPSSTAYRI